MECVFWRFGMKALISVIQISEHTLVSYSGFTRKNNKMVHVVEKKGSMTSHASDTKLPQEECTACKNGCHT